MSLFWVAAAGAGVAIGSGVFLAVLCFAFGSSRDSCVAFAAVVVLGAFMLTAAVISVVCWIRGVRK
jgi:asparagine N-glycosylation enzyme membrane subunit Stt3